VFTLNFSIKPGSEGPGLWLQEPAESRKFCIHRARRFKGGLMGAGENAVAVDSSDRLPNLLDWRRIGRDGSPRATAPAATSAAASTTLTTAALAATSGLARAALARTAGLTSATARAP
jgi:hypothetical protein